METAKYKGKPLPDPRLSERGTKFGEGNPPQHVTEAAGRLARALAEPDPEKQRQILEQREETQSEIGKIAVQTEQLA